MDGNTIDFSPSLNMTDVGRDGGKQGLPTTRGLPQRRRQ